MSELDEELKFLIEYLGIAENFVLPNYKELPSVDLYMEQVLRYVNSSLEPITNDEKPLTSFMVNNYVKAKIINEPVKKKYSKDQIGYLMAITLMKSTLSMSDMSVLLEFEHSVSEDKNMLYGFWAALESEILNGASAEMLQKVHKIADLHERDKQKRPEEADSIALDRLAYYALKLSIQAQANKLLSQAIIAAIRETTHGEEAKDEATATRAELKQEGLAGEMEANRLAASKQKRAKKSKNKDEK